MSQVQLTAQRQQQQQQEQCRRHASDASLTVLQQAVLQLVTHLGCKVLAVQVMLLPALLLLMQVALQRGSAVLVVGRSGQQQLLHLTTATLRGASAETVLQIVATVAKSSRRLR